MSVIAVSGGVMALLAANRRDAEVILGLLVAAIVAAVLPIHVAIEGNRRDARVSKTGTGLSDRSRDAGISTERIRPND